MQLYFAGYSTDKKIFKIKEAKYLLESYLLFKNKDYKEWHQNRKILNRNLFLDSGAFSAFTRKEKINIDEYIAFILENKEYIKVYATLDIIGDYKATDENLRYMEKNGLNPLPVFHFGSPISELKRLVKKYDYIALGGLVPLALNKKLMAQYLDNCFSIIQNKCKIHGFGVNAFWAWEKYPFYSVDATSWLMGGKFRRMVIFNKEKGLIKAYNKRSERGLPKMKVCIDDYTKINANNVKQYLKAAQYITELWKKRGVEFKD